MAFLGGNWVQTWCGGLTEQGNMCSSLAAPSSPEEEGRRMGFPRATGK